MTMKSFANAIRDAHEKETERTELIKAIEHLKVEHPTVTTDGLTVDDLNDLHRLIHSPVGTGR